jgi:hypothetical protein
MIFAPVLSRHSRASALPAGQRGRGPRDHGGGTPACPLSRLQCRRGTLQAPEVSPRSIRGQHNFPGRQRSNAGSTSQHNRDRRRKQLPPQRHALRRRPASHRTSSPRAPFAKKHLPRYHRVLPGGYRSPRVSRCHQCRRRSATGKEAPEQAMAISDHPSAREARPSERRSIPTHQHPASPQIGSCGSLRKSERGT